MQSRPIDQRVWKTFGPFVLSLIFWITIAHAQQESVTPRLAAVAERMKAFVDEGEIAGAVTLVAKDGKVVHLDAVGWEDRDEKKPMHVDSLFSIASMTKPVISVAALILCERKSFPG